MMDMMYAGTLRTVLICMLLTACARCANARSAASCGKHRNASTTCKAFRIVKFHLT